MEIKEFDSSNLERGEYDPDMAALLITFKNGAIYRYDNVGWDDWNGLCEASSAGSFFSANIRNVYPNERVG